MQRDKRRTHQTGKWKENKRKEWRREENKRLRDRKKDEEEKEGAADR